jgi:hypothetical protein
MFLKIYRQNNSNYILRTPKNIIINPKLILNKTFNKLELYLITI